MNNKTYNSLDQEAPLTPAENNNNSCKGKCTGKTLLYSFIFTIILFLALLIFTIVYVVENENSSDDSTADNICTTDECIKVSQELLSYIDDTINPCFDFFHYSCGGFAKEYAFELAKPERINIDLKIIWINGIEINS